MNADETMHRTTEAIRRKLLGWPRGAVAAPGSQRCRKMGSTGDSLPRASKTPVLIGSERATRSARRVAGRYRPVACATTKRISGHALRRYCDYLKKLTFHSPSEQKPERFLTALSGLGCRRQQPKSSG